MGNSRGSYPTTKERTMAAYDKLPPSARKALQDALVDWAVQPIYSSWRNGRKGFKTGSDIAARVAEWDQKQLSKWTKRRGT